MAGNLWSARARPRDMRRQAAALHMESRRDAGYSPTYRFDLLFFGGQRRWVRKKSGSQKNGTFFFWQKRNDHLFANSLEVTESWFEVFMTVQPDIKN